MKPLPSAYQLVCHVDDSAGGVESIMVDVHQPATTMLQLRYRVSGELSGLQIPEPMQPGRSDGLWRHTCFEMFFAGGGASYLEFNFSPSLQWAAYRFNSYREAMTDLQLTFSPRIHVATSPGSLTLDALIEMPGLTPSQTGKRFRMALAAVIEYRCGEVSRWALAHTAGKPDFHHPDGFVVELLDNGA